MKLPKGVAVAEEEIVVVGKSERLAVELGVVLRVKKTEKLEEGLELGESETETVELRVLATGESVGEAVLEGERVEEGLLESVGARTVGEEETVGEKEGDEEGVGKKIEGVGYPEGEREEEGGGVVVSPEVPEGVKLGGNELEGEWEERRESLEDAEGVRVNEEVPEGD